MRSIVLFQLVWVLQDAIYRSEYFYQIVAVILVLGSVLGFMIGSALGILATALVKSWRGSEEITIKKATWIGGFIGAIAAPGFSAYLIFSQIW